MTTNKPEVVVYRYTASRSFGKRNRKWHYQESFPHASNREVAEIGQMEELIRLSDYEALQTERDKLRKDVSGLLICDECHDKCADPYTGLFASHCPDEEPCIMCECSSLRRQLAATRAGWQETIAKTASFERPAYDEQQQRIAKLEATKLGLTKTMVELHAEQAKLMEALRSILGWRELRSGNDFPVERIEEIARDALSTHRN